MDNTKKIRKLNAIDVIKLIEKIIISKIEKKFKNKKSLDIDIHKKINLISYIFYYDLESHGLKPKNILKFVKNENYWKEIKKLLKKNLNKLKMELLGKAREHRKVYFNKVKKT